MKTEIEKGIDPATFTPYVEVKVRLSPEVLRDRSIQFGKEEAAKMISQEIVKALIDADV